MIPSYITKSVVLDALIEMDSKGTSKSRLSKKYMMNLLLFLCYYKKFW